MDVRFLAIPLINKKSSTAQRHQESPVCVGYYAPVMTIFNFFETCMLDVEFCEGSSGTFEPEEKDQNGERVCVVIFSGMPPEQHVRIEHRRPR